MPSDQTYVYAEISYSAELNSNWLDYVSEVIGRVAKANADGPYGREPGLGVEVLKPKFWKASGDQKHYTSLGKDILIQLRRLQMIDVEIQFKERSDNVLGTTCSVYKSDFYPMNGPSIVMVNGVRTEWTNWRVAVTDAMLPDVDQVT